jgi:hypothetical protein
MRKVPIYLEALLEKVAIIGFAFLLFYLAIRFVPVAHLNPKISDQIPFVSLFTGLVFGYFIWESRDWWTRGSFWAFTVLMTLAHLLAFLNILLRHALNPGRWTFVAGALLEVGLLMLLRNWLLPKNGQGGKRVTMATLEE